MSVGIGVFHGHVDDVTRRALGPLEFVRNQYFVEGRDAAVWLAVHGHTHVAGVHRVHLRDGSRVMSRFGARGTVEVGEGKGWFVNPGSVDGARRGEELACFAVLDTDARLVTFGYASCDHRASEERARRAGYRPGLFVRGRLRVRRWMRSWSSRTRGG
ncbi:MAG: metallophosphoesterase family protein [Deltaproteobacteria bacterium]|nr:metallophosphoesterase family protein [Deltaproteobacteria bacterium]